MFTITADQIDSRHDIDRAAAQLDRLNDEFASRLLLPADQNSGDEIQAIVADPDAALRLILRLTRSRHWSVGVGVGRVREPLPDATRKATGPAFVAARRAVTLAKRSPARFALRTGAAGAAQRDASEVEALIALLLLIRDRRTDQGWEVVDLLDSGLRQNEIADRLGISSQAVSLRVKAALWRAEEAARPALVTLMGKLDRDAMEGDQAG